ncbi:isochorismatase hydrolase [Salinisphaera sp. S4-8]|uniref:isochorismatase family cysteine hydrolase n=1 Tax=Salinisphaera sp. S4-8 TaxID=633357 RepID=UPI00333F8222
MSEARIRIKPPIERAAIVFIEFQGEWLDTDAPLRRNLVRDQDAFAQAIAAAARLIESARAAKQPIVHAGLDMTDDPHYLLFGRDQAGLRRAIARAGTWTGARSAFRPPFVPGDRAREFVSKGRSGASVLKNATLDAYLRNNDIRTVYFCGFATHVCVESSLREAHDLGLDAWIVADCCAAFTQAQHRHVLEHVLPHFGRATDSAELMTAMHAAAGERGAG